MLLECLAYNKDTVLSRTEIVEHIYDEDFDMDSNVVDVYINYLRNKIDKDFWKEVDPYDKGRGLYAQDGGR